MILLFLLLLQLLLFVAARVVSAATAACCYETIFFAPYTKILTFPIQVPIRAGLRPLEAPAAHLPPGPGGPALRGRLPPHLPPGPPAPGPSRQQRRADPPAAERVLLVPFGHGGVGQAIGGRGNRTQAGRGLQE